ncbi:MAG TPA: DUF3617 domain-containing protein [Pseudomonadales bacterium]|nr:DUF3617 domain-containing protein [Pseudomonadales bacterium]
MHIRALTLIGGMALVASAAMADGNPLAGLDIKPGLWEIQHKTSLNGQQLPDMQQIMASVPPGMRGQVEDMMKKNGAGLTEKGLSVCVTAEQIAKAEFANDPKGHCKTSDIKRNGNKLSLKMRCDDPKGEGETEVIRINPEKWTSVTHMTIEEQGRPQAINSEATGKWLGADCGNIKPR